MPLYLKITYAILNNVWSENKLFKIIYVQSKDVQLWGDHGVCRCAMHA